MNTIIIKMLLLAFFVSVSPDGADGRKTERVYYFALVGKGNPYCPMSYENTIRPTIGCPGSGKISVIAVPASDLYTKGPFKGKPKVDLNTVLKNELYDDIGVALSSPEDPTTRNGRTFWQQN